MFSKRKAVDVCDCTNNRIDNNTSACQAHQAKWWKYTKHHTCQTWSGVYKMLLRPGETQPWDPQTRGPKFQYHDDNNENPPPSLNYFIPAWYYCVETMCALLCGVVIAWTKFAKSESTKILQFQNTHCNNSYTIHCLVFALDLALDLAL